MLPNWSPTSEQLRLVRSYAAALESGDVALFAGAGLSRAAGYVDWRGLLRDIADELRLDIDRESDLVAIAQYHINEKKSRGRISQVLIDEFTKDAVPTRLHSILARLPIPTVWTTNYDQLIEHAFVEAGKRVDVKVTVENLAQSRRGRDLVLYKMHGCVTQPQDAVLTKDDYERYDRSRSLFVEGLKGDLIAKTFLFVGFSFSDPNVDYILSRVRVLLGSNHRSHYCVMRRPPRPPNLRGRSKADFEYEERRTALRHADLQRFGIETVWIEEHEHLEHLLRAIAGFVNRKSLFVSGAAADQHPLGQVKLDELARALGAEIIRRGYNLVSGFGKGLGEQCVLGALGALYRVSQGLDLDRVLVRPFPRSNSGDQEMQNTRHREDLLSRSGCVIVLAGNRYNGSGQAEMSPGVLEEVRIARRLGLPIIPVGVSGHAAHQVWLEATTAPGEFLPGIDAESDLKKLGDVSLDNNAILEAIFRIVEKCQRRAEGL